MKDSDYLNNNEYRPVKYGFMVFAILVILSTSMLALTVNGLVALTSDDDCGKNEAAVKNKQKTKTTR